MRYKNILIFLFCLSVDILLPGCDSTGNKGKDLAKPDTSNAEIKNIVFFGNSLTAGYGLDSSEAYPALIQLKIDSFHLPYKVVNAGVPGITTADGNSLVDAVLDHPVGIFNLELGGRFNHHNQYGNNFTYSFNPSYLIHERLKLFVNITSGFRAPSISELFGPFGANPNLKPEKSTTQEAGLQTMSRNKKLEVTITGFNRNITDVIIYEANGYENRDKQHDYGGELEAGYSFNERLSFKINYTYVDGKITQKISGKDTSYYNLIRRPKNNTHLFVNYQPCKNFFVSTSLQVTGKRTDTYYDPTTFLPSEVALRSYALWNLYAQYSFIKKKLNLFVDAKNLTNKKNYYEIYGYSVQGLNITGGIRFKI